MAGAGTHNFGYESTGINTKVGHFLFGSLFDENKELLIFSLQRRPFKVIKVEL